MTLTPTWATEAEVHDGNSSPWLPVEDIHESLSSVADRPRVGKAVWMPFAYKIVQAFAKRNVCEKIDNNHQLRLKNMSFTQFTYFQTCFGIKVSAVWNPILSIKVLILSNCCRLRWSRVTLGTKYFYNQCSGTEIQCF